MEQDLFYDFSDWYQKRKTLWKAIQLPGSGVEMITAWRDHSQLYQFMTNADQYAMSIQREEVNCRRLKKQTTQYRALIKKFEETVETLENMAIMYRLTYC